MLVNMILILFAISGMVTCAFYMICLYKQYKSAGNIEIVELFPKEDIYAENAYEGEKFEFSDDDKMASERLAVTQRGSVRIANGVYFTSNEYAKYRERVLSTELP